MIESAVVEGAPGGAVVGQVVGADLGDLRPLAQIAPGLVAEAHPGLAQSLSSDVQGALEAMLGTALLRAMVAAGEESASLESLLAELDRRAAAVLDLALLEAFRPWVREKLAAFS